jgi:pimeloyl-ACP methyl ester carboxylesterase
MAADSEEGSTMATCTADDGTTLYYEFDETADAASTVVFLNGMTQSTRHWTSQVERFRTAFRVLTYDARGQGRSELGETPPSMDRHVEDLAGLLDALEVSTAHLVGFSHGARLALGFAARRPDRLDRLVLASLSASPTARARTIARSWRVALDRGGLEALTWTALPSILGNTYLEQHEHVLEGIARASMRRNSEEGIRALLEGMDQYPDPAELAGEVEAPTLVLSAEQDLLVDADGARELAESAGGRHSEISGVGHTIPIEAPDVFYSRISDFLQTESP